MRQTFFIFILLIFSICAYGQTEKVSDTTLFKNITDINLQIKRSTQSSASTTVVHQVAPHSQDTIKPIILGDSLFIESVDSIYQNPLDLLYRRTENGTLALPYSSINSYALQGLTFKDTLFYNPLFLPMIFNGKMLPTDLSFYPPKDTLSKKGLLIPQELTFAPRLADADFVSKIRRNYYMENPDKIKYSVLFFDSLPTVVTDEEVRDSFNPFKRLITTETTYSLEAPDVEGVKIGRRYWVSSGEHSLQFSQNYFSDNWHKGGTNNLNINNYHALKADYKKNKVKFSNTLEWRLSVFNAPEDSIRKYRIGEDMVRYSSSFAVDAFAKGWSYSTNLEARTQLFKNYAINSTNLRSTLLSPLYANLGVGLTYQLDKKSSKVRHRRVRWNIDLSPISVDFRYVDDENVSVKRYGIEEGKKHSLNLGSNIKSVLIYDFTKYITWNSRFTYFTSYKKVVSEFENTLNLSLSNAFSTRIYLNLRYDDGVPPHEKFKYLQFHETLSFGFNFKW